MSHINTLATYKDLVAKGMDSVQAEIHVQSLLDSEERIRHSVFEWVKELKEDFASQKLISILGGLILLVGAANIAMMWHITVDVEILKHNVTKIMAKVK
jgi:hypothetical protein